MSTFHLLLFANDPNLIYISLLSANINYVNLHYFQLCKPFIHYL